MSNAMTSMNVSLPESMREWIEKRLTEGGYGTTSELIRDLVRREQIRLEREAINEKLRAALRSGSRITTDEDWEEMHRRLDERTRESPGKRAG